MAGGVDGVDGVVLSRRDDRVVDHQRLCEERAVERKRPVERDATDRWLAEIDARAASVVLESQPRARRGDGCPGPEERERQQRGKAECDGGEERLTRLSRTLIDQLGYSWTC